MALSDFTQAFPWSGYSRKLAARIDKPKNVGVFSQADADSRTMRLAEGNDGTVADGNAVRLYWLVDPEDGVIADAKFQVFGQSALIGAADAACELLLRKNYEQARRIGAALIDKELRERAGIPAFPADTYAHLNLVIGAIDAAAEQCSGIPMADSYVAPPAPTSIGEVREGGYPGFDALDLRQQLAVIEEVLNEDVRPYIALDGGGVEIKELKEGRQLIVAYQGACTSCFSATGATLSYIQHVVRAKVHPDLQVVPDLLAVMNDG